MILNSCKIVKVYTYFKDGEDNIIDFLQDNTRYEMVFDALKNSDKYYKITRSDIIVLIEPGWIEVEKGLFYNININLYVWIGENFNEYEVFPISASETIKSTVASSGFINPKHYMDYLYNNNLLNYNNSIIDIIDKLVRTKIDYISLNEITPVYYNNYFLFSIVPTKTSFLIEEIFVNAVFAYYLLINDLIIERYPNAIRLKTK